MPFGKHAGVPVNELPDKYLGWVYENILDNIQLAAVREAIEEEYEGRELFQPRGTNHEYWEQIHGYGGPQDDNERDDDWLYNDGFDQY
jgi:uncharacterized protein (DUF3820 family)